MPRVASTSCSLLTQAPFTSHVACSMCSAVFSSSPWTCFCSGHHVCYLLVAGGFLLVFCFPRVSLNCFPSFSNPLEWRAFLTFYYLMVFFFFFYSFYSLDSTSHLPCGCYVSVTCISINSLLPASASSCKGPSSSLGSIPFYGDAFKLPMCLDNFGGKKPWCYRCVKWQLSLQGQEYGYPPFPRQIDHFSLGKIWLRLAKRSLLEARRLGGMAAAPRDLWIWGWACCTTGCCFGVLGQWDQAPLWDVCREGLWKANLLRLGYHSLYRKKENVNGILENLGILLASLPPLYEGWKSRAHVTKIPALLLLFFAMFSSQQESG